MAVNVSDIQQLLAILLVYMCTYTALTYNCSGDQTLLNAYVSGYMPRWQSICMVANVMTATVYKQNSYIYYQHVNNLQ